MFKKIIGFILVLNMLLSMGAVLAVEANQWPLPEITPPANQHPRLYLRQSDISTIKTNQTKPSLIGHYNTLISNSQASYDGNLPSAPSGQSNANTKVLRKVEACAYRYLINNEQEYGPIAINIMKNYLNTVNHSSTPGQNDTRIIGEAIYVTALVYDWCYDIIDTATKQIFRQKVLYLMSLMEIGYPPTKGSAITSHSSEAQLMRDQLSAAIAFYDEDSSIYNNVAGRFFEEFIEARDYFYSANFYPQGNYYSYYRYRWDLFASFIFERMGYPNVFSSEQATVPYRYIYTRRPDGQVLRDGDSSHAAQLPLGNYWHYTLETAMAGSMSKDPYLISEYLYQETQRENDQFLFTLLFFDPDITPAPLSELPLTKYFPAPLGAMTARTGWDLGLNSNTVVADMKIQTAKVNNHQHQDSGTFQIYYKGSLATESGMYQGINGEYSSDHDVNYHKRTIAHNGLLIYNPNEQFNTNSKTLINDGGQKFFNNLSEFNTFDAFLNSGADKAGEVLAYEYGPSSQTPYYSYIKGDITNSYSSKVSKVERSFMFLNTQDEDLPGIMFVYDKIDSTNPSYKKTWLLHSVEEPSVYQNKVTIERTERGYNGKLVNTTLYPKLNNLDTNVVEGYFVNGVEFPQVSNLATSADALDGGKFRVEISPKTNSLSDDFLNVIQVMDRGKSEAEVTEVISDKMIGAKVKDNVVLFSKSGRKINEAISFSASGSGNETLRFVIADLAEGNWCVRKDGDDYPKSIANVTSHGGVFYFEGTPGVYTLSKEAVIPTINVLVNESLVKVSGVIEGADKKNTTVMIVNPNYNLSDITESNIKDTLSGATIVKTDQTGKFSTEFILPDTAVSGSYKAFIGCETEVSNSHNSKEFFYLNKDEQENALTQINTQSELSGFKEKIKYYINDIKLIPVTDDVILQNLDSIINMLYKSKDKDYASLNGVLESIYREGAVFSINRATTNTINQVITNYESYLKLNNKEDYSKYKDSINKAIVYLKDYDCYKDFDESFVKAIALGGINAANNAQITELIGKYNNVYMFDLTGGYASLNKTDINKALMQKEFKSFVSLRNAFNERIESLLTPPRNTGNKVSSGETIIQIVEDTDKEPTSKALPDKFPDISEVPWAKNAINELAILGVINGDLDGNFRPNDNIKREEFIKLLVVASSIYDNNATCEFADVKESDWFYPYIASAKNLNLINGVSADLFGSGQLISREEMAAFTYRFAEYMEISFNLSEGNTFLDHDLISDYAKDAIKAMSSKNIINGKGNNMFSPKELSTRAEAAVIIHNLLRNR